jgi:hypothetical protein
MRWRAGEHAGRGTRDAVRRYVLLWLLCTAVVLVCLLLLDAAGLHGLGVQLPVGLAIGVVLAHLFWRITERAR